MWVSAVAVILACIIRYLYAPSFWLDEAVIAGSLRDPSLHSIFSRLGRGEYFPRVYLLGIGALREILGYKIWVLRLVPSLSFIVGTVLWARLLGKRSAGSLQAGLLGAALLVGSVFWLNQAIQLKQYSLDVMLALAPFLLDDDLFRDAVADGRHRLKLVMLALPCFLSYTYPMALGARAVGWYLHHGRRHSFRAHWSGVCAILIPLALGVTSFLAIDYRQGADLTHYWNHCILRSRLLQAPGSAPLLVGDFFWGWHLGRLMPLVIAVIAPLQALGAFEVVKRWRRGEGDSGNQSWGSRSLGSLVLLVGVILASLLVNYPICAGRLVLFTQVHTQILAVEGALFILGYWKTRKIAPLLLYVCIAVVAAYSGHRYVKFIREEPSENIRPMLPLIKPEVANIVWVHPCSVAQVKSLPEPLPVTKVMLKTKTRLPQPGQKVWILWTHMTDEHCQRRLAEVRGKALSWQVIHQGPDRGLALAEF